MARLRSTASSQQSTTTASRQALKEKTNTSRAKKAAHQYEDDGNTEDLVKEAKPKRGRSKKVVQESDDLMMAGGLGLPDDGVARSSERQATTDELAKSDPTPPAAATQNRRPPRTVKKVVQSEAQNRVMESLKQRMEKTARGQRAKPASVPLITDSVATSSDKPRPEAPAAKEPEEVIRERSEFSLSPSPPPAGKFSAIKGPRSSIAVPGSVLKAQNTPAHEASILALKNFKRRPRQPSMLAMVQQRTASARPSLANTVLDTSTADDSSAFDLGLSDDGEDDFAPEAEGTPLHGSKTKRLSTTSIRPAGSARSVRINGLTKSNPKKRKSDEVNISSSSLSALRNKRRKSFVDDEPTGQISPASRVEATVRSSSERAQTPVLAATSDVHVVNSPSTSTPPTDPPSASRYDTAKEDDFVVPSTEREQPEQSQDNDHAEQHDPDPNGTMAEPLSSSPARPDRHIATATAEELADPLSQETDVVEQQPKPKKKAKPVFTSTLQSLLPKRRQPLRPRGRKSEYDIDSESDEDDPVDVSHLEDDEDELGATARRRTKAASAKTPKSTNAKRGRPTTSTSKKATRRTTNVAASTKKGSKTYGRDHAASDKENEGYESAEGEDETTLPEISMSMEEVVPSKELEAARNKFAEVDDWDMELESMSAEFHRSSSQEWR